MHVVLLPVPLQFLLQLRDGFALVKYPSVGRVIREQHVHMLYKRIPESLLVV